MSTAITGLLKIEFPDHTVLLNDGGVTVWNGDTYTPTDTLVGSISSIEAMEEGIGEQIPALDITFAPPDASALSVFSDGAIQKSPVRLWIAEFDIDTGEVVGTPELRFIGFVDQPQVSVAFRQFSIAISVVPEMEWLFQRDTGNGLSATFHKSLYAGETGHDNATGLNISTAWGVESPRKGGGSYGGGGGGGRSFGSVLVER